MFSKAIIIFLSKTADDDEFAGLDFILLPTCSLVSSLPVSVVKETEAVIFSFYAIPTLHQLHLPPPLPPGSTS